MDTFFFLAKEAYEKMGQGFGFNFDIFETNLINLSILCFVLIYFGRKLLGETLSARSEKIAAAINDAEARQKKAAEALADQQQKLAQAQQEAVNIRKKAEENAVAAKAAIAAKTAQDIERLKETAAADLSSQQERAIAELKQRACALALERVESRLQTRLNKNAQKKLINRSIAQLGGS